ncbi:hypothetical protein GJR95_37645 [Spirosoma endbachense]|uniref:TolC family protein n=2 Tax=Spirosoma endbachense TaxID=2666025 RepID=A0A6P1WB03_9BACT|nr:hypothetical protein GJR95_37645 [Spirosoma endbachense]
MRTFVMGIGLLLLGRLPLMASAQLSGQSVDSTNSTVFWVADFYRAILDYHPLVKQASLLNSEAQQEVLQARGAFDPKLFSAYDRKEFGNSLYYDKWQSGVSIPIRPAGIDLKMTYDRNRGEYVNPEDRVPETGLATLGIRVPIGQGLLIDARRNALRQAQLAVTLADADRLKLINKTLYEATKTYWEWYLAHQQFQLLQAGYQLAQTRFRAVQQRALLGDAAAIDTTEALITTQDRLVQLQQAEVNLNNARLRLSVFLWNSDEVSGQPKPVEIPPSVVPQSILVDHIPDDFLHNLLGRAIAQHPELLKLTTKGRQLALEERFQRSLLQPQLALNASLLSRTPQPGLGYDWTSYYSFRTDNHKIGVDLTFPLFLRKERGKLRQVQLKTQQLKLAQKQTLRDIENEVQTSWNELNALKSQISIQQQTVLNQRTLLQAEQQKFELGESSLFLVNSRESKLIELEIKLAELRTKHQKAVASLWYLAGTNPETQLP